MGMLHLWSASAYNISVFSKLVDAGLAALHFVNYHWRTFFNLLFLFFFWCMSSQTVSMQRAMLMVLGLLIAGRLLGRQFVSTRRLIVAVGLLLLLNPTLLESWSLRFSAAASWGVITLFPLLQNLLYPIEYKFFKTQPAVGVLRKMYNYLKLIGTFVLRLSLTNLALFMAVQLALLPLLGELGAQLGLIGVLSNTLVASFTPLLMLLGFFWFGWNLITWPIVQFEQIRSLIVGLSLVMTQPLDWFLALAHQLSSLNGTALIIPQFSPVGTILWFLLLFIIGQAYWLVRRRAQSRRLSFLQFANYTQLR
jgi:predicted membrane metal-binding protein